MTTQSKILEELHRTREELHRLFDEIAILKRKLAPDPEQLVGISKASELTGISKAALRQRATRGTIPCTKDETGHLLFTIKNLQQCYISQTAQQCSQTC